MDDRESAAMLRDCFRQEAELYRSMLELCRAQSSCIAANDQSRLMSLLSEKQRILRQVEDANTAAAPLLKIWHGGKADLPAEDRQGVEGAFAELKAALSEVVAVEEECQRQVAQRKSGQSDAISNIHNARSMARAYGSRPPSGSGSIGGQA